MANTSNFNEFMLRCYIIKNIPYSTGRKSQRQYECNADWENSLIFLYGSIIKSGM